MNNLPVIKLENLNFARLESTVGLITPELAGDLLKRNFDNNRNLSTPVSKSYARTMSQRQWFLADPIKFSCDEKLIDGQHRLNAVILSGEPQPFVIMTGYDLNVAEVLDQGKKRNARDIGMLRGKVYTNAHVSITRMCLIAGDEFNTKGQINAFTGSQIVDIMEHFEDKLIFASQFSTNSNALKIAPVLACVLMASFKENHERLTDFLYCWHHGIVKNGIEDNAAITFREFYLTKIKLQDSGGSQRVQTFKKAQSCLMHFLSGTNPKYFKEIDKLQWGTKEFSKESIAKIINKSK
jgi:hypothetical protein